MPDTGHVHLGRYVMRPYNERFGDGLIWKTRLSPMVVDAERGVGVYRSTRLDHSLQSWRFSRVTALTRECVPMLLALLQHEDSWVRETGMEAMELLQAS